VYFWVWAFAVTILTVVFLKYRFKTTLFKRHK
jgi:hypothetical protein